MNRVYKVIWSKAKHCYVVTSEIARNHGGKAASAGMKSMMAALIAAMALTGAYIPANAADSVKDSVSANTELTLFLNAIAEGSYDAVEMAVEEGKETAALPAGQHTVYDENGFYVKQSTNQTYNSLTKDGLWVGGHNDQTGLHVDNEGNLKTTGTVTAGGEVKASSANLGGVEIGGGNVKALTGTIGGVGLENGNVAAKTATIENLGVTNNISAKLGTIGGVGFENGNVAAKTAVIGKVSIDPNGKISGVANGTDASDAATYGQVKRLTEGLEGNLTELNNHVTENTKNITANAKNIEINTKDIARNTADISRNAKNIEINTADIARNTKDISRNAKNIETNTADIARNTKDISRNAKNIETNSADIARNTKDISTNAKNIETNTADIARNTGNIEANAQKITANKTAIGENADKISANTANISSLHTWTGKGTTLKNGATDLAAGVNQNYDLIQSAKTEAGKHTTVAVDEKNLTIENKGTDGQNAYTISLKDNLTLTGLTAERGTIGGVQFTGSGKITNVAAGTADSDAATVGQIKAVSNGLAGAGIVAGTRTENEGTAIGTNTTAAWSGVAIGTGVSGNTVAGNQAVALGMNANAADSSTAIGSGATASESLSVVIGHGAASTAGQSLAIGQAAKVTANQSVALGANSIADEENVVSVGNSTWLKRRITNVADGIGDYDAVNVRQLNAFRKTFESAGVYLGTIDNADKMSIALGDASSAKWMGVAIGKDAKTEAANGTALGYKADAVDGSATAVGSAAEAKGTQSTAIGQYARTNGFRAAAFGANTYANGTNTLAIGGNSRAEAKNAVALGANSVATEENTISVGHKAGDPQVWSGDAPYDTDLFRRITNVADGKDAHDAATVGQMSKLFGITAGTTELTLTNGAKDVVTGINTNTDRISTLDAAAVKWDANTTNVIGGVTFNGNGGLTVGNAVISDTGISFDGKSYITSSGLNANGQTITNVGTAVNGTDAVNKTQLEKTIQTSYNNLKKDLENISAGTIDLAQLTSAGVVGGTRSNSQDGIAIGSGSSVTENATIAVGRNARAEAWGAIAVGGDSAANNMHATAVGVQSKAQANQATALGFNTTVTGQGAVAIGSGSVAAEAQIVSFGKAGSERRLVNVKAGVAGTDAVNKNQMDAADASLKSYFTNAGIVAGEAAKSGANATSIAIGSGSTAKIQKAVAVGINSNAAIQGTAIGDEAKASVWAATAVGNKSTASGNGSVAFGFESAAIGGYGVSLGARTQASALNTVAIGNASKVSGERSTGIGSDTYVTGNQSVALGNHSVATEDGVISVGHKATDQKPDGASDEIWDNDLFRRITNVADGTTVNDAATVGQLTGKTFEMNGTTYGGAYISTADSSVFLRGFGGSSSNNYGGINIDLKKATNVLSQFSEDGTKYAGDANADIADNDVTLPTEDTEAKTFSMNRMAVMAADEAAADTTESGREPGSTTGGVVTDSDKNAAVKGDLKVDGNATFHKGANMAGNKVTNVGAGDVSEKSTDAVNGSQLYTEQQARINADNALGSRIDSLGTAVHQLGGEIDSVGAISSALAGLHPLDNDPSNSKYQLAAAFGGYDGSYALALGGFYNVNKDILLSGGVSTILRGERKTAGNVGVTFRIGAGNAGTDMGSPEDLKEARQQVAALKQDNNVLAGENRKLAGQLEAQGKKLAAQDEKLAAQDQKLADMEKQLQDLLKAVKK